MFRELSQSAWLQRVISEATAGGSRWKVYVLYVTLLHVSLLAPGSAAVLVLIALPIFGANTTFVLSLVSGVSASFISHQVGWHILGRVRLPINSQKLLRAKELATGTATRSWLLAMLTRALPNPLYDVWGYAFGALKIPLHIYLPAATIGGAVSLALICYLPNLIT
jgi:uncharacterized membrane protein YdjX (TVP38/TMEM64 family)